MRRKIHTNKVSHRLERGHGVACRRVRVVRSHTQLRLVCLQAMSQGIVLQPKMSARSLAHAQDPLQDNEARIGGWCCYRHDNEAGGCRQDNEARIGGWCCCRPEHEARIALCFLWVSPSGKGQEATRLHQVLYDCVLFQGMSKEGLEDAQAKLQENFSPRVSIPPRRGCQYTDVKGTGLPRNHSASRRNTQPGEFFRTSAQ